MFDHIGNGLSGMRAAKMPGVAGHIQNLLSLERHERSEEVFGRELRLFDHDGGAVFLHVARFSELVRCRADHKRHEDTCGSGGTKFSDAGGTGSSNHKVAIAIGRGHIVDKAHNLSLDSEFLVARRNRIDPARTALMDHRRALFGIEKRQGLRNRFI